MKKVEKSGYKILSVVPANTDALAWFIDGNKDYFITIEAWGEVEWTDACQDGFKNLSGFILSEDGLVPADILRGFEAYVYNADATENPFVRN